MADVLVSAILQTIIKLLGSVVLEEIGLLWGLKDDISSLEDTLRTIQLVLQDAELKQRKSDAIHNWLRKLKNAAYDAENILDQIATHVLRRRANSERGMKYQLKSSLSLRNPLLFRTKMVHEMKSLRKKLDSIAKESHVFQLCVGVVENRFGVTLESRITSSLVNESEIYGRHEEKEMMIEKIVNGSYDEDDLSVYAIQGMGGLGKTTLSQLVYNDERTERHFELRMWVCVSDDFSVFGIVRAILECIEGGGCNISSLDPLQNRLQERLRGRRYLLVLDDIWNENHRLWDDLKQVLRCGSKGSVLIVTTRIEKVASMMASTAIHHIECLSEDDSWSLFSKRAFANGDYEREESLFEVGRAIVKKCGGVPLAIKALGSLMRLKSDEREWLAIKESEIWHLSDDENGILPALRLSYDNLVPQMRQCFAYCCIFPKDCWMEENELIQLWMANGYIPSDGQTNMYLCGHLIFKELVWRSFLQDSEIHYQGNRCKMHDLMHDLASSVMKDETYILEYNKKLKIPKTLHHLCFDSGLSWDFPDDKSCLKLPIDNSLRSMIVHKGNVGAWRKGFFPLLFKQKYLRALDVRCFSKGKLPDFIWRLEHLRYLAMACTKMKSLPESLTNLHNLETLKLTCSNMLLELPKGLKVMKRLCFLEMTTFRSLLSTPPGLGNLTCLCRLSIFIVGQEGPHQIHQLKDLDLGGELSIQGLDNVRNLEDAKSANLKGKMNMTSLSLSWKKGMKEKSAKHFEEVLEGLQPHQNLENISISSYHGSKIPNWISTLVFRKLKGIRLEDCPRCERLPPFGKLPSLTWLRLDRMDSIKCLDDEFYGDEETSFPALKTLYISSMPLFEKWITTDSAKSFPCLELLNINNCPKLGGLPKLPTLRSLTIVCSSVMLLESTTFLTSLKELDVLPKGLLENHKALEYLEISSMPIRTLSNVLDNLSALKTLNLNHCSNLEFLPEEFKFLTSLHQLDISSCDELKSFPATLLQGMSSLRSLTFINCKKLKPLLGHMTEGPSLDHLVFDGLPELEVLPESLQQLRSLESLGIYDCQGFCSLPNWLGSLESLLRSWFRNCEKLKSLPDGCNFPKSMRMLCVYGCPLLEKRCEKGKEDWPKISHIPIIKISRKVIQHLED